MKFTKMNGLGNDYIYVDVDEELIRNPSEAAKILSDRHFGVGGDGLVLMQGSRIADAKMSIYNADGSEAELCGNALRCVAKYAYEHGWSLNKEFLIETKAGVKKVQVFPDGKVVTRVSACLGRPKRGFLGESFSKTISYGGKEYAGYCVDVGNPHFVIFLDEFIPELVSIGENLGKRKGFFQEGANVEFVKKTAEKNLFQVRVIERGSGETYACGTGAAAVFFCTRELNLADREAQIELRGGIITCSLNEDGETVITGDVTENFRGETNIIRYGKS